MVRRPLLAALTVALVFSAGSHALAQADRARIMGTVIDTSGGALPGVTVTITGTSIAPTPMVTDEAGRYLTPWLAPGRYNIAFTLSGFENREYIGVTVYAGQIVVLDQQLPLAPLTETVEVKAEAPKPASPPRARRPPPPPRPKLKPTEELLASVCGPREPPPFSLSIGKIVSHRDDPNRQLLGPGDPLRIETTDAQELTPGQSFVIRRRFQTGDRGVSKEFRTFGEQTVGLVQLTEVRPKAASAVVVYACAEILAGDTLEPYVAIPGSFTVFPGKPQFDHPAKVAFGEYDRTAAGRGNLVVIDRGMMQGVERGQQVTVFRRIDPTSPPVVIAEGLIVAVRPDSATLRIEHATDAVLIGDLVALHR